MYLVFPENSKYFLIRKSKILYKDYFKIKNYFRKLNMFFDSEMENPIKIQLQD